MSEPSGDTHTIVTPTHEEQHAIPWKREPGPNEKSWSVIDMSVGKDRSREVMNSTWLALFRELRDDPAALKELADKAGIDPGKLIFEESENPETGSTNFAIKSTVPFAPNSPDSEKYTIFFNGMFNEVGERLTKKEKTARKPI